MRAAMINNNTGFKVLSVIQHYDDLVKKNKKNIVEINFKTKFSLI